jgi:hypothetical protein
MAEPTGSKLAPQARSPAYPYIALDTAIDRIKQIYGAANSFPQPREVMAQAYGKPATSSATIQTFATLLQYGLLQNVLHNGTKKLQVSQLAQTICNQHAPPQKVKEAIQEAALKPKIFQELWQMYGSGLGSLNESIPIYYLTTERKDDGEGAFTEKAAREVLRTYQATLSFAGITGSDKVSEPAEDTAEIPPPQHDVKVGDFAQAEVNGAFQFQIPKRVEEIREHDGKLWVFFEGESTAVQMNQTVLQAPPAEAGSYAAPVRDLPVGKANADKGKDSPLPIGWSEETLIDDGGEEIKIRYQGKASVERYEFIRDYLAFKIARLAPKAANDPPISP